MTDIASTIAGAALSHGQDPATMLRMAQIESSLDPNARNASGASGLFQIMPKTGAAYGLSNPYDAAENADVAARLLRDNRAALTKTLGRDPTGGELYLAHQQGAGGAASLLAHPDAPAASIVGTKAVLQNGGRQDMTAGQFVGMWTSKFEGAKPATATAIGSLFANPAPSSPSAAASHGAPPTPSSFNPAAAMAAQLPLDAGGELAVPRRAPTVANGGAAEAARRRALITGQGGFGALFAT